MAVSMLPWAVSRMRLQLRLPLLELLQQFDAAHARQVQVEQGHVEARWLAIGQRLLAAAGLGDGHAVALEAAGQRLAQLLVVIDDQQADRRAGGGGHRLRRLRLVGGQGLGVSRPRGRRRLHRPFRFL